MWVQHHSQHMNTSLLLSHRAMCSLFYEWMNERYIRAVCSVFRLKALICSVFRLKALIRTLNILLKAKNRKHQKHGCCGAPPPQISVSTGCLAGWDRIRWMCNQLCDECESMKRGGRGTEHISPGVRVRPLLWASSLTSPPGICSLKPRGAHISNADWCQIFRKKNSLCTKCAQNCPHTEQLLWWNDRKEG